MKSSVTLAIPTFNRYRFLLECVQNVIGDPRISEITISDDFSTDGSFSKLMAWAAKHHPKVTLYRNRSNVDCYANKAQAVRGARRDWVILFDDDNVMPSTYLDVLFALPEWDRDTVYCPEFAEPHFDYTEFSGMTVTRQNVAGLMTRPPFATALNTANYFFHKSSYLGVWDGSVNPHTADSIYQAYRLLNAGKKLYITPGLRYFHRVHDGSHFKREHHKTGRFASEVEARLKSLK